MILVKEQLLNKTESMDNSQEGDSDMECSDNECYDEYYYNVNDDSDIEQVDPKKIDPEYFEFKCLLEEEVDRLLNETVETLSNILQISPSLSKVSLKHSYVNNNFFFFICRFYYTAINGV